VSSRAPSRDRRRLQAHGPGREPVGQRDAAVVEHRGDKQGLGARGVGKAAAKVRAELVTARPAATASRTTRRSRRRPWKPRAPMQADRNCSGPASTTRPCRVSESADLDPTMGRAYSGMGATANSLGRRQDAEEYYKLALARTGRMTEREKYRTRSGYYLLTRNTDKAREELLALLKQFPTDSAALSNLALTEFYRRDMATAFDLGRRASNVFPNSVFRKNNAALYGMYAGDFAFAEKEAAGGPPAESRVRQGTRAMGLSQLATDRPGEAVKNVRATGHASRRRGVVRGRRSRRSPRSTRAGCRTPPASSSPPSRRNRTRRAGRGSSSHSLRHGPCRDAVRRRRPGKAGPGAQRRGRHHLPRRRVLSDTGHYALALELVGRLAQALRPRVARLRRVAGR